MDSNLEQHELYENARKRVQQKKRLYYHFVLFLIGSVFLIVLNKILKLGEDYVENWFVWAISLWFIILCIHFVNVFFVNRFFGKEWQRKQTEKLVEKQEKKIAQLSKKIEKKLPSPTSDDEIVL
jgi:magnesium-transporting ATPase (P-type)